MSHATQIYPRTSFQEIRQIHSFRQSVQKREDDGSGHLSLALIDSYLWSISRLYSNETPDSRSLKKERLKELKQICIGGHAEVPQLQRAAMEIPQLADPGDNSSVQLLARLLAHKDNRLRRNACKAIGLVGGKEACAILQSLVNSTDADMRLAATEALQYCEMQQLAGALEDPRRVILGSYRRELQESHREIIRVRKILDDYLLEIEESRHELMALRDRLSPQQRPPVLSIACAAVAVALLAGVWLSLFATGHVLYGYGPRFFLGLTLFCGALSVEILLGLGMLLCCHYSVVTRSGDYDKEE